MFYNLNPQGSHVYTPDPSRPAFEGDRDGNESLRLTWQVSTKHKISAQQQVNQQISDHFYGQGAGNRRWRPTRSSTTTRGRPTSRRWAGPRR